MKQKKRNKSVYGYTVMELVIVIIIVAIMVAVAIPSIGNIVNNSRIEATETEMMELVRAVIGDRDAGFLGYLAEMNAVPGTLPDLYNIGAQSPYNPFTRTGWNGPYVSNVDNDSNGTVDIIEDAWSNGYTYNSGARTITSNGPDGINGNGDDITVTIP